MPYLSHRTSVFRARQRPAGRENLSPILDQERCIRAHHRWRGCVKTRSRSGVNAALMEVLGATGDANAGGSTRVILHDVTEGNWAAGARQSVWRTSRVPWVFPTPASALRGFVHTLPRKRGSSARPDSQAMPAVCCRQMHEAAVAVPGVMPPGDAPHATTRAHSFKSLSKPQRHGVSLSRTRVLPPLP